MSIDNSNDSTGKQPNILGGNLNFLTTVTIAVDPEPTAWEAVTFGDKAVGEKAKGANDSWSVGAIPDSSGNATIQYQAILAPTYNDELTASVCQAESSPLAIYLYNPYLDDAETKRIDIGQSQVNNALFVDTTYLTQAQVQAFLQAVPVKDSTATSFLANFYFVDTNGDNSFVNGFFDANDDKKYDEGDPMYCSDGSDDCIPLNTPGLPANLVSQMIVNAAVNYGINPGLLLVKLQVEHQLNTVTVEPTYCSVTGPADCAILNDAMGCMGAMTFFDQLNCAASVYYTHFQSGMGPTFKYPYFFPQKNQIPYQNIQYAASTAENVSCKVRTLVDGCFLVGYYVGDASTYSQIKYTPFVQTSSAPAGGGVRLFEQLWFNYSQSWR
jgi:hypothetical protein